MSARRLPTTEDDFDRKLLADIARVGWSVLGIEADEDGPDFAYSLGIFHTLAAPEILIMGLKMPTAQRLINDMGDAIRSGRSFEAGRQYDDIAEGLPLAFVAVSRALYREYVGYARWFYGGSEFPLLQCVWPDKKGRFPWQPRYDVRFFQKQRILGPAHTFPDGWLFPDPPTLATFTTRQVMRQGAPILYVVHDADDGSWQFLTGEPVTEKDAMIVCLKEMVRHDPGLTELENLPPGWRAWREAPGKEWQREKIGVGGRNGD